MKRVLLDECTPAPLAKSIQGVEVRTVEQAGFTGLENGDLLNAAEGRFDILITADKNLRYQQNLSRRRIAILELPHNSWPRLKALTTLIQAAVDAIQPGEYVRIQAS